MFFRSQKYSGCHAPQDASINTRKGWSVWRWTNESDTDILWASTRKELDIFPLNWPRAKKGVSFTIFCLTPASALLPDYLRRFPWRMIREKDRPEKCWTLQEKTGAYSIIHVHRLVSSCWERTLLWQILFSHSELMLKLPSDKRASWSFMTSLDRRFKSCFLYILTLLLPGCILVDTQFNFA